MQFKALKIFQRALPTKTPTTKAQPAPPPEPPPIFGRAKACMLITLAFPIGAWQPQL